MNQIEAEQLAARLGRVWVPETAGEVPFGWKLGEWDFRMHMQMARSVELEVSIGVGTIKRESFELCRRGLGGICTGHLYWSNNHGDVRRRRAYNTFENQSLFDEFADKWLSVFRRNLIVCGVFSGELTAHEMMEHVADWTKWARTQGLREEMGLERAYLESLAGVRV